MVYLWHCCLPGNAFFLLMNVVCTYLIGLKGLKCLFVFCSWGGKDDFVIGTMGLLLMFGFEFCFSGESADVGVGT